MRGQEGWVVKLRAIGQKLRPSTRVKMRLPEKVVVPFYQSAEWRALMASIIGQRGRRCEDPAHDLAQPRSGRRIYGDHVRELRDGGAALDPSNVMLRCASCHGVKTAAARAARRRVSEG